MRVWTVHLRETGSPVLLQEGWSWGAFLFRGLWLLVHRAWIPGLLWIAAEIGLVVLLPPEGLAPVGLAAAVLAGLHGRDLLRWQLRRRGYALVHVITGRDEDTAWARLFARRPDLSARTA